MRRKRRTRPPEVMSRTFSPARPVLPTQAGAARSFASEPHAASIPAASARTMARARLEAEKEARQSIMKALASSRATSARKKLVNDRPAERDPLRAAARPPPSGGRERFAEGRGRFLYLPPEVPAMTTIYYEKDADLGRARGPARRRRRLRQPGPLVGPQPARLRLRRPCLRRAPTRSRAAGRRRRLRRPDSSRRATPTSSACSSPTTSSRCCRCTPTDGAASIVASGYTLAFDRLVAARRLGHGRAPRMLGPEVRRCYEEGVGFITAVGVHRDATGRAQDAPLAIARRSAACGRARSR